MCRRVGTMGETLPGVLRQRGRRFGTSFLDGDRSSRKATPDVVRRLSRHAYVRAVELGDGIQAENATGEEGLLW